MNRLIAIICIFSCVPGSTFLYCQPPAVLWANTYGGSAGDEAKCIRQTSDGGYIVAGTTRSAGTNVSGFHGGNEPDVWITKLDSAGGLQWQKCYGGSNYDEAYTVQQTTDGGYIVAGTTRSPDGDVSGWHAGKDRSGSASFDMWVFKISGTGQLQWQRCLGGSKSETAYAVIQTADGGYMVAGEANSLDGVDGYHVYAPDPYTTDVWIVKLNGSGNQIWNKAYGSTANESARSILQTSDGGYFISGLTGAPPPGDGDVSGIHGLEYDAWVLKTDTTGSLQWQRCLGGTKYELAYDAVQTAAGDYVVVSAAWSSDGDVQNHIGTEDIWVMSLNSSGSILWQNCFGGSFADRPHSIRQTSDGGYIIAGETQSTDGQVTGNHGSFDYWLVKISPTGTPDWQKTLGGSNTDQAFSATETSDGGYIITGNSNSSDADVSGNHGDNDFWVVRLGIPPCTSSIHISTAATTICVGAAVSFTAVATNGGVMPAYQWKVNDADAGNNSSSFTSNTLRSYDRVSCVLKADNGCSTKPAVLSNFITVSIRQTIPASIGADTAICTGSTLTLSPSARYRSYRWQDGSVEPRLVATGAGTYFVQVQDSCGVSSSDTVIIHTIPLKKNFLPPDTAICSFETLTLRPGQLFRNYRWSNRSTAASIVVNTPGQYWLQATDSNGCAAADTVLIRPKDCGRVLYFPSAFTPNNDARNDVFRPRVAGTLSHYELMVFNRWGRLLYTTKNIGKGWDGNSGDGNAGSGVFIWVCSYQFEGEPPQVIKGTVTLIQ